MKYTCTHISSCYSLCEQVHRQTDRQTNRQTDRQTDRQTWNDEVLNAVSISTEASHVDREHPIGSTPAVGGAGEGQGRRRGGQ